MDFKLITSPYEMARPNLAKRLYAFTWMMRKLGVIHIFTGSNREETLILFFPPRTKVIWLTTGEDLSVSFPSLFFSAAQLW